MPTGKRNFDVVIVPHDKARTAPPVKLHGPEAAMTEEDRRTRPVPAELPAFAFNRSDRHAVLPQSQYGLAVVRIVRILPPSSG
jgi:hypothetical protein